MKKKVVILVGLVLAVVLMLSQAYAWRSVRTGQKNFERAWSAFLFKRSEKAAEYFGKSADAFGLALAENPPSRTTMFPSNLTMAGISSYYAGRYDQALDAMGKANYKDDTIWEGFFYSALSCARKGDRAKALEFFERYLRTHPTQPILSGEVRKQMDALKAKSIQPEDAIPSLEDAAQRQFTDNVNFTRSNGSDVNSRCDGAFWWRSNRAPCSYNTFVTN